MDKENKNTPKGGPHTRIAEKPKNFSESIKKLFTKLQDFKISMLVAILSCTDHLPDHELIKWLIMQ